MEILDRRKMDKLVKNHVMTKRMRNTFWYACDVFGVQARTVLKTKSRKREVVDVKRCFANVLIKNHWVSDECLSENEISLITIGKLLGVDHATITHYKGSFNGIMKTDVSFAEKFNKVLGFYGE